MSSSSMNTLPEVGLSTPPSMCISVDFPLPELPTIATNSPCATEMPASFTAMISLFPVPYTLRRCSVRRISAGRAESLSGIPSSASL